MLTAGIDRDPGEPQGVAEDAFNQPSAVGTYSVP